MCIRDRCNDLYYFFQHGISKQTILKTKLANILNVSAENVDVFTVLHSPHNLNLTQLDVRFSAHGSPYYAPEKLNAAVTTNKVEVKNLTCLTLMNMLKTFNAEIKT